MQMQGTAFTFCRANVCNAAMEDCIVPFTTDSALFPTPEWNFEHVDFCI
jgi:hypothetical protein